MNTLKGSAIKNIIKTLTEFHYLTCNCFCGPKMWGNCFAIECCNSDKQEVLNDLRGVRALFTKSGQSLWDKMMEGFEFSGSHFSTSFLYFPDYIVDKETFNSCFPKFSFD